MSRRIVQIAAAGGWMSPDYGNVPNALYALCDDGTLWVQWYAGAEWESVRGIPHPDNEETF